MDFFSHKHKQMVEQQLKKRGIRNTRVLEAVLKVQRHEFVPESARKYAYEDYPLDIGYGQTISQPYIVAFMTEVLELESHDRVLEIGAGSGYQAAVLAELVQEVYSVEVVEPLLQSARARLQRLGYKNIFLKQADGYNGWPERAPFDAIIVTAAPPSVPEHLMEQLTPVGKMVIPVGRFMQELVLIVKNPDGLAKKSLLPVRFVPMIRTEKEM